MYTSSAPSTTTLSNPAGTKRISSIHQYQILSKSAVDGYFGERKCYIGLTERTFKDRLYKHRNSLRHRSKANSTGLSKYIWNLKDKSIDEMDVSWSI